MAVTILDTTWTVTCTGPNDQNLIMKIEIDRTNNALSSLNDFTIVDYIRDRLALATGVPVTIEKIETVRTTE